MCYNLQQSAKMNYWLSCVTICRFG